MFEIVLSLSSNSVDKAIDEYHDSLATLILVAIVVVVVVGILSRNTRLVFLGFP